MPELPEVEVTRRRIAPLLVGRTIAELRTTSESYFFLTPPEELRAAVTGRAVTRLLRLGKYLIAPLEDRDRAEGAGRLVIHLGMTGQLFSSRATSMRLLSATARSALKPGEQQSFAPDEHTHLHFRFADDGADVYLRDVRKFGKVMLLAPGEDHPRLA